MIDKLHIEYRQIHTMSFSPITIEMTMIEPITNEATIKNGNAGDPTFLHIKTAEEYRALYVEAYNMFEPCEEYGIIKQTMEQIVKDFRDKNLEYEGLAIYLDHLIQMGNFGKIYEFCGMFHPNELSIIVNQTPDALYNGTILHSVLYYHKNEKAIELYDFFRQAGAMPTIDYYDDFPWDSFPTVWVGIGRMLGDMELNYTRQPKEFNETYNKIERLEEYEYNDWMLYDD
jgi:hypothetical protein